jgi:hypothetical protein
MSADCREALWVSLSSRGEPKEIDRHSAGESRYRRSPEARRGQKG